MPIGPVLNQGPIRVVPNTQRSYSQTYGNEHSEGMNDTGLRSHINEDQRQEV